MYYKYFVISIKLYIFVYIKKKIIMPKSRHRKNHKKKAVSYKKRTVETIKSTNNQIKKIQEDLMEKWKEKEREKSGSPDETQLNTSNPETL